MYENKTFLDTGLTQVETVKILSDKMKYPIEYLTYNIRRYKVPVTLVLFYTKEDVSESIRETMRLTDVLITKQIGKAYFSFVMLPFTDDISGYNFIKHEEHHKLNSVQHYFHHEQLPPTVHNHFNFINSYLFKIIEAKENNGR